MKCVLFIKEFRYGQPIPTNQRYVRLPNDAAKAAVASQLAVYISKSEFKKSTRKTIDRFDASGNRIPVVRKIHQDAMAEMEKTMSPENIARSNKYYEEIRKTLELKAEEGSSEPYQRKMMMESGLGKTAAASFFGHEGMEEVMATNRSSQEALKNKRGKDTSGFDSIMRGLKQVAEHQAANPTRYPESNVK